MKTYRSSDDGEPSNSAGPPILGQIQSFDLTNVLVAVVRYYGGTNLGVGGLINAYRSAAKLAIENAEITEDQDKQEIRVLFPYERMPQVMQIVKSDNITILKQNFDTNCFLKLSVISSNELAITQLKNLNGVELVEV
jgi:putative IMPACT (imprinted ancient) family translation regulator